MSCTACGSFAGDGVRVIRIDLRVPLGGAARGGGEVEVGVFVFVVFEVVGVEEALLGIGREVFPPSRAVSAAVVARAAVGSVAVGRAVAVAAGGWVGDEVEVDDAVDGGVFGGVAQASAVLSAVEAYG